MVDSDTTINSLVFTNLSGYHTVQINPGRTLTINGIAPGYQSSPALNVGLEGYAASNQFIRAAITGSAKADEIYEGLEEALIGADVGVEGSLKLVEAVPLTGVVLAKLDSTAKGGVVVAVADRIKIPVRFVGLGEALEDLREFDAREFVEALFATDDAGEQSASGSYAA